MKLEFIAAMAIFGTIGVFRRYIPLGSELVASVRGLVGCVFLLLLMAVKKQKPDITAIKKNMFKLIVSGVLIGFNWILLFEAYQYTSVAVATLCYYMAPVFVTAASPLLFREKLTIRRCVCVLAALVGMVFVSGVLNAGVSGTAELKGVACGIGAALLYASIMVINKHLGDVEVYDRTTVQLGTAGLVLIPYTALAGSFDFSALTLSSVLLLLTLCVVHTGFAYAIYFDSLAKLRAQTSAFMSYIDPVVAIICSALLLKESFGVQELAGIVLILGSAIISELPTNKKDAMGQ